MAGARRGAGEREIDSRCLARSEYSYRYIAQVLQGWQAAGWTSLYRLCFSRGLGKERLITEASLQGRQFGFPVSDGQDAIVTDFVKTRRQAVL